MKKLIPIILVLVLTLSLFAGCRSRQEDMNDTTGTQGDMLPDANDRIDPTNGANKDTEPATTAPTTLPSTMPEGETDTMPDTTPDSNARSRRHH